MTEPIWVIMPILAHPEYTTAAIADLLAQTVPVRLLLVNQGVDDAFRAQLEAIAEEYPDRVLLWSHQPPLPSLSATWNRALDCAWQAGAEVALVVNNDVRLHRQTIRHLSTIRRLTDALFVSCVGVTPEQFDGSLSTVDLYMAMGGGVIDQETEITSLDHLAKGGPDFSCFLIARACHDRFRFDESFTPAFCEDLDYHRRLMLAGEGRRIFSVNLPYLHYGSATRKTLDDPARARLDRAIEQGSRAYYAKKWGGPVNGERFFSPFDDGVEGISTAGMPNPPTTPALQSWAAQETDHA